MKQKLFLLLIFIVPLGLLGQAQLNGKVTSADDGLPLPGATVVVVGTTNGTMTDFDGNFSLGNVDSNASLSVSYVGFVKVEVPLNGQSTIDIALQADTQQLDEVVLTGYSTERKVDLTGALSVVNVADIADTPSSNPMQSLQGRVPGLFIESTGDPSGRNRTILIRGLNTLGNNSPLYIIDGVPSKSANAFSNLNPNTIESIQVLKDASASSIYGSRASNGVIIVTTKGGEGKFKVDLNTSTTAQNNWRRLDVLNTQEYGQALWQASINDGTNPSAHSARYSYDWRYDENNIAVLDKVTPVEWIGGDASSGMKSANTDWQDTVFRTGLITSTNLTISGATKQSSLLIGLGYLHNQSVIEYNKYEKINARINSSTLLFNDKLKIGENLNLTKVAEVPLTGDHNGPGIANFHSTTLINNAYFLQPILPVRTEDGGWSGPLGPGFSDRNNPLHMLYLHRDNRINDFSVFGDIYAEFSPIKNLVFKTSLGVDYTNSYNWAIERNYQTGFLGRTINYLEKFQGHRLNWNWTNTANYNLEIKKHRLNFLLGMESIKEDYQTVQGYKEGFADQSFDYFQFGAGTGVANVDGLRTGHQLLSYFGKVNYGLADKYLASLTARVDGSSRFGNENKYGVFPAITLGWRINNEGFLKTANYISELKIRAGAGRVGNQEIGDQAWYGLYATNYGAMDGRRNIGTAYDLNGNNTGNLPSGYVATQLENTNLKWETTEELNVGIDYGFFQEKLYGSFDYYSRKTKDILTRPPYAGVIGEGGWQWVNGASMENKGFEFVLGHRGAIGSMRYNVLGSVSSFKDEITFLPESVVRSYPGNVEKTILGRSRTSVFGYVNDGIFQTQQEVDDHAVQPGKGVGRLKYVDLNNDGKIDPLDQDWLGTTLPDYEYGINTEIAFKDFTFSFFLQGVKGRTVNDGVKGSTDFTFGQGMNFGQRVLSAWTPQNTDSSIPMLSLVNSNQETRTSNYFLVNGSYLKLRNAQIGYSLPSEIISKMKIEQFRIYLMGENLLLFRPKGPDAFTGPDPETPGSFYPRPISFTLGFNITL